MSSLSLRWSAGSICFVGVSVRLNLPTQVSGSDNQVGGVDLRGGRQRALELACRHGREDDALLLEPLVDVGLLSE